MGLRPLELGKVLFFLLGCPAGGQCRPTGARTRHHQSHRRVAPAKLLTGHDRQQRHALHAARHRIGRRTFLLGAATTAEGKALRQRHQLLVKAVRITRFLVGLEAQRPHFLVHDGVKHVARHLHLGG